MVKMVDSSDRGSMVEGDSLPIHFFTIVLNGEPFIRYHIEVLKQLPFRWHWHVVEGVAEQKKDSSWMLQFGGRVTSDMHHGGLSHDGTREYLDELAQAFPDNVTIYRKADGAPWVGKVEMVNAPLVNIQEECLLWQIDVDELWTLEQILKTREMFRADPRRTAAFYWCWYFVSEDLVVSTRNCYSQNPAYEWLRTWRYRPGAFWASHSPPILAMPDGQGNALDLGRVNPFTHAETEANGLIFQHYSVVTEEQVRFKEAYYGYQIHASWMSLQSQERYPVFLRDFFHWVKDQTQVIPLSAFGIQPVAYRDPFSLLWTFRILGTGGEDATVHADPFRSNLPPLPLDGRRESCVLHIPDWTSTSWADVVIAYCEAFSAQDEVTLVLWVDPEQGVALEEASERIAAELQRAGVDTDQSADILLIPEALDQVGLARLFSAVDGIVPLGDDLRIEQAMKARVKILQDLTPAVWRASLLGGANGTSNAGNAPAPLAPFGRRNPALFPFNAYDHLLDAARQEYANQRFHEAFDAYEQMLGLFPDRAIEILAEVYDRYQALPDKDSRYQLYQARAFNFGIQSGDKVLDVGSGHLPFPFATHLAEFAVRDNQYGRAGLPFKYLEGRPVFECSVEAMPFTDREFDFVYCSHVLEHVDDPAKACNELMRVAKRGYIETPTRGKDLWLNTAGMSNHRWAVELVNDVLSFTEYTQDDVEGLQSDILLRMHCAPETMREKAMSALVYLKARQVNTMLLWEDGFKFEVRRRSAVSSVMKQGAPEGLEKMLPQGVNRQV